MNRIACLLIGLAVFAGCRTAPVNVRPIPPNPVLRPVTISKLLQASKYSAVPKKAGPSLAAVTLAWDPSPDPTVVGYDVFYGGASQTYTNITNVGNVTAYTVTNLLRSATYFFAVDAYNSTLHSDLSNEISYMVPTNNPVTNIVTIANQIQTKTSLNGAWLVYTNLPVVTLTNPPDVLFFRSFMVITQTNSAKELIRLNSSTLVITNK